MSAIDFESFLNALEANLDEVEPGTLAAETLLEDFELWDSLAVLTTIAMADAEYDVGLSGDELGECATVRDIFDLVSTKRG